MSSEIVLKVENIGKRYEIYEAPHHRLLQTLLRGRKQFYKEFWALKDVSFEFKKGECLGIIGRNGSGKSTLLQIIAGTLAPTTGSVSMNGKVAALLELGSGFNPEFTGRENVYMNGAIMGFSRTEMDRKFDEIAAFADIGEFIEQPVKIYSSGMVVRLAFAVTTCVDPDILIVDEALSVGDAHFQFKSMNKMKQFIGEGKTVLFVSHDSTAIKSLCRRAILLEDGKICADGGPNEIIDFYNNKILVMRHQGTTKIRIKTMSSNIIENLERDSKYDKFIKLDTGQIEVVHFGVYNEHGNEVSVIESETNLIIQYILKAKDKLENPHYGISIKNRLGNSVFNTNTYCMGIKTDPLSNGDVVQISYILNFNLVPEDYSICFGVSNIGYNRTEFKEYILGVHDVEVIKVIENKNSIKYSGYFNMFPRVEIIK
jgi:lipopolysaccharide transport system ATP-binding protein